MVMDAKKKRVNTQYLGKQLDMKTLKISTTLAKKHLEQEKWPKLKSPHPS